MRFLTRSLVGLFLLGLTFGLLAFAGGTLYRAFDAQGEGGSRGRPAEERAFAVNVETLSETTANPIITAYGEIESWRTLEVRADAGGRIMALADTFRDGGRIAEGELLFQIDPADARTAVDLAETESAEANAELTEARAALELAEADLQAARDQSALRQQSLARQQDLQQRGAGTVADAEDAALALASAEQTLVGRRQALATAEARINRAEITLARRKISLAEAERVLTETESYAPFGGLMSEVTALRGGLVNANEKLGILIDPSALEVAFRVSNAQFARLLDDNGRLRSVDVVATLTLDDIPIAVSGRIDRAGAEVGDGQTGRLIYARLDDSGAAALRPGDFMTVEIAEPPMPNVAVIPAAAATTDGRILLIGEEERLEEATVRILRRQADTLVVGDAPFGREFATARLPQLGAGVKVRPVRIGEGVQDAARVALTPDHRARLIAAVEANTRMPNAARTRLLERLNASEVPADLVARIETQMGGGATSETVSLDDGRRARLIAFVEQNTQMPADAKARILAQLEEPEVPKEMVDRLEQRMGG